MSHILESCHTYTSSSETILSTEAATQMNAPCHTYMSHVTRQVPKRSWLQSHRVPNKYQITKYMSNTVLHKYQTTKKTLNTVLNQYQTRIHTEAQRHRGCHTNECVMSHIHESCHTSSSEMILATEPQSLPHIWTNHDASARIMSCHAHESSTSICAESLWLNHVVMSCTWIIYVHMCGSLCGSYVWQDTFIRGLCVSRVTWHIYMWYDTFICAAVSVAESWRMYRNHVAHQVQKPSRQQSPPHIWMCHITYRYVMWHDSRITLVQMCLVTYK